MRGNKPGTRTVLRRWRRLLVVVLALGLGGLVDTQLKSGEGYGYCPGDALWQVSASDFGQFWTRLEETQAYTILRHETGAPLAPIERYVHRETGIRPTGSRWRIWMGKRLLAAKAPSGYGVCVRPGLLLRAAHILRHSILRYPGEDGVFRYGDVCYAWRDGYLIASPSADYVRAALVAAPASQAPALAPDTLHLARQRSPEWTLELHAKEGLPVEGVATMAITPRDEPLTLAHAWPQEPVASLAATRWRDLGALASFVKVQLDPKGPFAQSLNRAAAAWMHSGLSSPPADWDAEMAETALAFSFVHRPGSLPLPEAALAMRATEPLQDTHPLGPLLAGEFPTPFEWQGEPGLFHSLLGPEFAICLGRNASGWLAASREPLMAQLAERLHPGDPVAADMQLRIDWARGGASLARWLGWAGERQVLPGGNAQDVQRDWGPWVRALESMGTLEVVAKAAGDRTQFHGMLVSGAQSAEERP